MNRRQFVQRGALSAACLLGKFGFSQASHAPATGKFAGLVDFQQEGSAPVGQAIGEELDQRVYTDLSRITTAQPVTPTHEFFVRSGASTLLPDASKWTVSIDGLIEQPLHLDIHALRRAAKPMGLHLIECAGNVRIVHFGLISAANWTGVPLSSLLAQVVPKPGATQVCVSGFDTYANPSLTSIPGASWIFPLDALKAAGAFLAMGMNGAPLTRDHGSPIRLVIPGWYGCSCIKWVQSITLVDDMAETTSQMREYAARTLQDGVPALARDFEPPTIDHAAMPVRVERWSVAGKFHYRVLGILWGGSEPVKALKIRFNPEEEFMPVTGWRQRTQVPWTVWEHAWSPQQPGLYAIQLAVAEPKVRARKMDAGYYVRSVDIGEV